MAQKITCTLSNNPLQCLHARDVRAPNPELTMSDIRIIIAASATLATLWALVWVLFAAF